MARDCPNAGSGGGSRACHKVCMEKSINCKTNSNCLNLVSTGRTHG